MNRSNMGKQVLQAGTHVTVDSKGRRSEAPLKAKSSSAPGAGMREYITATNRRSKDAGLKRGGAVKKAGKKGC